MKEHRIMADPLKFCIALATCLVSGYIALRGFQLGATVTGILFVAIFCIFFYIMYLYGSVLHLSQEGIRRIFLFIPFETLSWDQVEEIGVVGVNVFNGDDGKSRKKRKTGRRYIYISPTELSEDERFKMALEWPPKKGTLYCTYTREHADAIQFLWSKPIATYNAGDIFIE